MGRIPTLGAMLFIGTFLSGCATTTKIYTYKQYESEVLYGGSASYNLRATMRQTLLRDDHVSVCLNMPVNLIVAKMFTNSKKCIAEEESKRPSEFTENQMWIYGAADATCAGMKFRTEYMDSIDLNTVPANYLTRCRELKTLYAGE